MQPHCASGWMQSCVPSAAPAAASSWSSQSGAQPGTTTAASASSTEPGTQPGTTTAASTSSTEQVYQPGSAAATTATPTSQDQQVHHAWQNQFAFNALQGFLHAFICIEARPLPLAVCACTITIGRICSRHNLLSVKGRCLGTLLVICGVPAHLA